MEIPRRKSDGDEALFLTERKTVMINQRYIGSITKVTSGFLTNQNSILFSSAMSFIPCFDGTNARYVDSIRSTNQIVFVLSK
jgi:hypothetical protein